MKEGKTTNIIGQWLSPDDALWADSLAGMKHDIYHVPGYAEADGNEIAAEAISFCAESGANSMLIPLLERVVPGNAELKDTISPYGYGGPIYSEGINAASENSMLSAFKVAGQKRGLVCSFLRLNPILNANSYHNLTDPDIMVVEHGDTVSIDLSLTGLELDRSLRGNLRRDIKKIREAGFTARFNHWDDYDQFQNIYWDTMARLDASDTYNFSRSYFDSLRKGLGSQLVLCSVLSPTGDLASAGLFGYVSGFAQYHLGATSNSYLQFSPSKLMLIAARDYFQSLGGYCLHLGGGLSSTQDSLYRFKQGFGTHRHRFRTMRIIHNRPQFEKLNRAWEKKAHRPIAAIDNYFPPYRYI